MHYAALFSSPAPTSVQYFVRGSIGDLVSPAVSARKPPPAHYCWRVITPLSSKCTALRSYLTIFESSTKNKVFQEARKGRFILDSEQHLSFPSIFNIKQKSNLCNRTKSRKLDRSEEFAWFSHLFGIIYASLTVKQEEECFLFYNSQVAPTTPHQKQMLNIL